MKYDAASVEELREAVRRLYRQLPVAVADDIKRRVEAVLSENRRLTAVIEAAAEKNEAWERIELEGASGAYRMHRAHQHREEAERLRAAT